MRSGGVFFAFLVLPPAWSRSLSEVIRARSAAWYGGATGVLTAAIPWILRGSRRGSDRRRELHVSLVLGLTGRRGRTGLLDDRRPRRRAASAVRYRADVARILIAKAENRPANV